MFRNIKENVLKREIRCFGNNKQLGNTKHDVSKHVTKCFEPWNTLFCKHEKRWFGTRNNRFRYTKFWKRKTKYPCYLKAETCTLSLGFRRPRNPVSQHDPVPRRLLVIKSMVVLPLKEFEEPTFAFGRLRPSALLRAEDFLVSFAGCKAEALVALEPGHARVGDVGGGDGEAVGNLGDGRAVDR
jgi:hypothetical protein